MMQNWGMRKVQRAESVVGFWGLLWGLVGSRLSSLLGSEQFSCVLVPGAGVGACLERTFQIMKSNHQPGTTTVFTTELSPQEPHPHFSNTSRDSDPTTAQGSCARPWQPFTKYVVNPKILHAGQKSCCCSYKSNSCILWVPFISSSLMLA